MRVIHRVDDNAIKMELSISQDRLKLFARIIPREESATLTLEALLNHITEVSPKEFLEMDVVKDILDELKLGRGCESRRIARGQPPETGRDGKVVWMVRRFNPAKNEGNDREFTDFFTLGLFENVEAGTEIARVYRPGAGTPGLDVQGKELHACAGKLANLHWDKSVELKADPSHEHYTSVVANVAGYVHEEGNWIAVRDTVDLEGNLDFNTGHIDFVGHVRIAGDVQKGFHIKARGDITIGGNVLGGNVLTSGGSISIDGFHLGNSESTVTAKGNYSVGMAQGVVVSAGGNLSIDREARDCSLRAGLAVFAGNAAIVGGNIWCVRGVEADQLGNSAGVTTTVELRNELEVTTEYRALADSIKKHEAAVAALELHIGPYLKNRHRVPLLKNQFRVKIKSLLDKYDGVVQSLSKLCEQERLMRESKPVQGGARISASGWIHAGVVLTSNDARLELKESVEGPVSYRLTEKAGDWVLDRYQRLARG
jgi:uncharacterized protein (DUF342 family)